MDNEPMMLEGESEEVDFINQIVAEAVEYLHVKNLDRVVDLLSKTDDTAGTIGALAYKTTRGLLEKHKKAGMSLDIEMDTAMGVATEVIDMIMEINQRVNADTTMDEQRVREDALLQVMMQHSKELSDDEISRDDAAVMLRGMMQDGTVDEAFGYVNRRAKDEGLNINDIIRKGDDLRDKAMTERGPQKKPVSAGVEQALMGGA